MNNWRILASSCAFFCVTGYLSMSSSAKTFSDSVMLPFATLYSFRACWKLTVNSGCPAQGKYALSPDIPMDSTKCANACVEWFTEVKHKEGVCQAVQASEVALILAMSLLEWLLANKYYLPSVSRLYACLPKCLERKVSSLAKHLVQRECSFQASRSLAESALRLPTAQLPEAFAEPDLYVSHVHSASTHLVALLHRAAGKMLAAMSWVCSQIPNHNPPVLQSFIFNSFVASSDPTYHCVDNKLTCR